MAGKIGETTNKAKSAQRIGFMNFRSQLCFGKTETLVLSHPAARDSAVIL